MDEESASLLQSAVRLPTPEPEDTTKSLPSKRKRPSSSRSPSPRRRPFVRDVDPKRAAERERQLTEKMRRQELEDTERPLTEAEKQEKAKEEYQKLLNMRSGGTYIPPAKLRALQAQVTDKSSKEYQRMAWEALKKSINGLINKVNVSNIKHIVPELFGENLLRGRGLFCRSIMKAQAASLPFTPIYAAMAATVNTKLPQVGELLMKRLVVQFRKAYKRNDKSVCLSSSTFIAQLCNQGVVNEMLAAQLLQVLLSKPTDDSVEIAVGFTREVGDLLERTHKQIALLVFEQFRNVLHEADIDKRTQYMIEVLFQVRKDKYKENPAIKDELDLVEEEDQITHQVPGLDANIDTEDALNVFKLDPNYEQTEEEYKQLKAEILGENEGSDDEGYDSDESSTEDEESKDDKAMDIKDQSNTDLTNLRRTIYLTINSSADFEECCHKLMKINLPPGRESELPSMIIETCSQRPTYEKFYGLIGERFARLNRLWTDQFEQQFVKYYDTIHRYETNRLRNIARFFGHVLGADAIGWHVLSAVHINEEETTASSRIFIKILFQDLQEEMGAKKLQARMRDETLQHSFEGLFPKDNPRNTRFAINYFTSIQMGMLTEDLREFLKNMPKPAPAALPPAPTAGKDSDSESVSSYSSYTGSSRSSSSRRSERGRIHSRSPSRSPPRRRKDSRSASPLPDSKSRGRKPARSISRSRSRSASPPPRKTNNRRGRSTSTSQSRSRSASPLPQRKANGDGKYESSRRRESPSLSRSPPRRDAPVERRQDTTRGRRRNSSSVSASRSPPPRRDRGRDDADADADGTRSGRRNSSSVDSRSPSRSPYRNEKANASRAQPPSQRRREPGRDARQMSGQGAGRAPPSAPPAAAQRQPERRDRSLSPYSKRLALTKAVAAGTRR